MAKTAVTLLAGDGSSPGAPHVRSSAGDWLDQLPGL